MALTWKFNGKEIPFEFGSTSSGFTLFAYADARNYAHIHFNTRESWMQIKLPRCNASVKINDQTYNTELTSDGCQCVDEAAKWINDATARLTPAPVWFNELPHADKLAVLNWAINGSDAPDCIVKRAEELHADSGKCGGLDDDLPDLIDGIAAELEVSA